MRALKNHQPRLNFIKEKATSNAICSLVASTIFWVVSMEMQQNLISYLSEMHLKTMDLAQIGYIDLQSAALHQKLTMMA